VPIQVAIDGFRSRSRQFLQAVRAGGFADLFEIAQINAPEGAAAVASRIKFDSIYGRAHSLVTHEPGKITIGDAHIAVTTEADVSRLDWSKAGIDVVVTESGENARQLLDQGAKKVIVIGSATGDDMHTLMLGINDSSYDPENHHVAATGHCTANALAPLIAVLNETFGAARATYTVINPVSDAGAIADRLDRDGRTARAAWRNIVPAPELLCPEIVSLVPPMAGKLDGISVSAPVAPVGWLTLSMETERRLSREEAIGCITDAAVSDAFVGIIGHTDEHVVSSDIAGDARSVVVDLPSLAMLGRSLVSIRGWFDAEWAIACRTADIVALVCEAGISGTA
jgi:glyceraldehyde 3-phosphate dehydrogenase (phosphorylating)